jgi:hypothetical protein
MNNGLKITPIRTYAIPEYPSKCDVQFDPALLQAIPKRWNAKPAVCVALLLTISSGLYGCGALSSISGTAENRATSSDTAKLAISIPVFDHGNGRGSYGCIIINPPVFLSEEEARQIIREVAESQGVHFDGSKSITGNNFPATHVSGSEFSIQETWKGMLDLDGYDASLGIGYEFVSKADMDQWEIKGQHGSSVSGYDIKGTARRLAKVVEETAVFYDPVAEGTHSTAETKPDMAALKAKALENLREQVRDFLAWLAAEGII